MCNISLFISFVFFMLSPISTIQNGQQMNCTKLRNNFANSSAQFTLCSIDNARPITLCKDCVNQYLDVVNSFQNMSKVIFNGTSCLDMLVNQDRLQIVQILYDNSVDLWSRAKCDECYEDDEKNQTNIESNKTKQFLEYHDIFLKCTSTAKEFCSDCMKDYIILDNFYKSISNINEKIGVCMDLVDIMNTTWTFWSSNCCKYRRHDEYIFIGSTVGVLIFTVLFYVLLQFCKEKNAPTIIQQSRFFGSLNIFRD